MRARAVRVLVATVACLLWLNGCETSTRLGDLFQSKTEASQSASHELHPRDLESWIGLAACYDRQRRFDLADRAYDQATKISGPTAEILNNRGYSYMLRGDQRRARETLLEAQARDPGNAYVKNNLELLEANLRKGKATQ